MHFVQSSAHEFYSYTQYGTVVSFNALHHMPRSHHPIVFDNASSLLKEDGVALFLVPGQGCVLHEAMENVCKADRWVSTFSDFDLHKVRSYENADYYKQVCFAAGFNDVDSSFSGVVEEGELSFEELIGFMSGWLPHLAHLEVKENNSAMLEEHKSALLKDIATLFFAYKHTSLKEKAKLQSYENRIIASKISLFSHNSSLASLGDEVKCAQEIAMTRP